MRCVDVNVLVDAHRVESTRHELVGGWLDEARRGREPLALARSVSSGFLRIVTHPRIFRDPTPLDVAIAFVRALEASPSVVPIEPGDRQWEIFLDLCLAVGAKGNVVPDAFLAALAIEQGATFVTSDRGFLGVPGLRVEAPAS